MAAESKRPKLMKESMENIDPPSKYTPSTLFSPFDVILVVEGLKLHVHKEMLTDKSPVFKRMFESDFKEKGQIEISLPGKKIKHFEEFLWTLYNPGYRPITKDNVFKILPLSDEYQVSKIKNMCESFIIQTIQQVISREVEHPGIDTLLNYVSNVEKYNLTAALPHVVHLCAKYSIESLTRAAAKNRLSPEMLSQICIERVKAMDTLTKHKMEKGDFNTVLETLDLHFDEDTCREGFMKKYEDQLIMACKEKKITRNNLVDFIIAGEKYNLKTLLSVAIDLASYCDIYNCTGFNNISNETNVKIFSARVHRLRYWGTNRDIDLS